MEEEPRERATLPTHIGYWKLITIAKKKRVGAIVWGTILEKRRISNRVWRHQCPGTKHYHKQVAKNS